MFKGCLCYNEREQELGGISMKKAKEYKISSTLFYIASVLFYLAALINIIGGVNTSIGITWLCLGSTFLCLGGMYQKKTKENDEK